MLAAVGGLLGHLANRAGLHHVPGPALKGAIFIIGEQDHFAVV